MKENKNRVYKVYDLIANWFDEHRTKDLLMEKSYLKYIEENIPLGGKILDVGCGTGEPIGRYFIEKGYKLIGVDASEEMINICKHRFPDAQWVLEDMRKINFVHKFDLAIAWHSIFHLPHNDQKQVLQLLASFVTPKGLLVFTSGTEHSEEWTENGGYKLYQASLSEEEYKMILETNSLNIIKCMIRDPDCGGASVWIAEKC